jgi:hypothetical protein
MIEEHYLKLDKYTKLRPCSESEFISGSDEKDHYVYCTINTITKVFYIGKHSSYDPFIDDYIGSGSKLSEAITRDGWDNFYSFPVKFFLTSDEAYSYEELLITKEMIKSNDCYNLVPGGKGNPWKSGKNHHCHKALLNGTHHFLGNSNPVYQQIKDGLNVFCIYDKNPMVIASREDRHRWKGDNNPVYDQIARGTHSLSGDNHPYRKISPWKHPKANEYSDITYYFADKVLDVSRKFPSYSAYKITQFINNELQLFQKTGINLSISVVKTIFRHVDNGWNPLDDPEWLDFKSSYNYPGLEINVI